jgi:hypothetical protein
MHLRRDKFKHQPDWALRIGPGIALCEAEEYGQAALIHVQGLANGA